MSVINPNIVNWVRDCGSVSVASFMEACLRQYYTHNHAIGKDADFITAPEISQLFGEVIGAFLIHQWRTMGCPSPCHLIELGPGRGTLMSDILRVAENHPEFLKALNLHLVEINPHLRQLQSHKLRTYGPTWHNDIETLPTDAPWFLVANEFLDALPVEQWIYTETGWHERSIIFKDETLLWHYSDVILEPSLPKGLIPKLGDIYTRCSKAEEITYKTFYYIRQKGGCAILIDYGHIDPAFGDTIQSLYRHCCVPALSYAGEADITAHVDFAALKLQAERAGVHVPILTTQGHFLESCGIHLRAKQLKDDYRSTVTQALHRLTHPSEMGDLFKIMVTTT